MITMPAVTLYLLVAGAFILGLVIYDTFDTLILHDRYSTRFNARRNFPIRLIIYGLLAVIAAGVWIFTLNWVPGIILILGAIFAIIGIIWFSKNRKTS